MMKNLSTQLEQIAILPVVTAHSVEGTVALARTLVTAGIPAIEITCRTACAIDAIKAVKDADIDILLGVGTVTNTQILEQVANIGVDFVVSPGVTSSLLQSSIDNDLPLLPGVSSASEVILCMDYGLKHMKLFPAVPIGGLQLLKAFSGPFPEVRFCPTGGINISNFQDFLQMPNVFCIGGSWMVPGKQIQNNEWDSITQLCEECVSSLHSLRKD
jgi:2-dehydro-3-deoxyphosphogluconate aldolase / (4S)-4-hydroxy-2-oxoglutarate aldolase